MSLINDALKRAKKRTTVRPQQSSFSHDSMQPVGENPHRLALETKSMKSQPHTPWPWIVTALLALGLCLAIAGWFFGNAMALLRSDNSNSNSNPQFSSIESKQSLESLKSTPISTASVSKQNSENATQGMPPESQTLANSNQKPLGTLGTSTNATQAIPTQENSLQTETTAGQTKAVTKNLATEKSKPTTLIETKSESAPEPTEKLPASKPEIPVYFSSIPEEGDWPELRLQGIFYDADDPVALINNRDFLAGESVDQVEIVSIESKKVTLRLGTELKILQFRR